MESQLEKLNLEEEKDVLFHVNNIYCATSLMLIKGLGRDLHRGYFRKGKPDEKQVSVRRIKTTDCRENYADIVNLHETRLVDHINVLKIFGCDEDPLLNYRYFAIEIFEATLEQFIKGEYTGPMPSEAQVLSQIANGINYLHARNLTHGQLNPSTVLIAQSLSKRIKISDCGLLYKFIYFDAKSITGTSHPTCWMLSASWSTSVVDEIEIIKPNPTEAGDCFAAGCILFYYLKRGLHPYGTRDDKSILINIEKKDPVNLKELDESHFAFLHIRNLIGKSPIDGTQFLRFAAFEFRECLPLNIERKILGQGSYGRCVFAGSYEGNPVAVKRIEPSDMHLEIKELKRKMDESIRLNHPHVLKLLHVDEEISPFFRYLVLELCAGTLKDFCEKKYVGPMPSDPLVLYQIASGLQYIHLNNLVHGDIKPDNVLISITSPVQMKLSDFGLVKRTSSQGIFSVDYPRKLIFNCKAPELFEGLCLYDDSQENREAIGEGTIKSDIFAAGCVFFYFLTRGLHPFGGVCSQTGNILGNNPLELNTFAEKMKSDGRIVILYEMIRGMIKRKEERIQLSEVIEQLATFRTLHWLDYRQRGIRWKICDLIK